MKWTGVSTKKMVDERWESSIPVKSRATFSLPGSLHLNEHNSTMGSRNDEPFVGGETRLDHLSNHVYHAS